MIKKETFLILRNKYPSYANILDFFEKISEEQELSRPYHSIQMPQQMNGLKQQIQEGFPIMEKKDFAINIPASMKLFESIVKIGKNANEKMRDNMQAIEGAVAINSLNLNELLRFFYDESFIDRISAEFDIDKAILVFLINASIQPSISANVAKLKDQVDIENWKRGYCPVCGSSPQISRLQGEGRRDFLCSFCGFEWPSERLKCPFCENSNHEKLHYFYAKGEEAYRIDVCDNCHQYIKTVDSRKLDYEPDLHLEDMVTTHLDILATEKGYKRPERGIGSI